MDIREKRCSFRPGFEGMIGSSYERELDMGGSTYLRLHVGYEFTEWFNTSQPRRFFGDDTKSKSPKLKASILSASPSTDGGLTGFHGVTIGGSLFF